MKALIGDIGNTITKICLLEKKRLKVKKIVYINSKDLMSKNLLKKKLESIAGTKSMNKLALIGTVFRSSCF